MKMLMLFLVHQAEVPDGVIRSFPIDMVDDLSFEEIPSKGLFCEMTVLEIVLIDKKNVAIFVDVLLAAPLNLRGHPCDKPNKPSDCQGVVNISRELSESLKDSHKAHQRGDEQNC